MFADFQSESYSTFESRDFGRNGYFFLPSRSALRYLAHLAGATAMEEAYAQPDVAARPVAAE